ncbi:MAG TPA: hypothetical protein VGM35_08205 [Xanthobacteraceae bacterium]
MTIKLSTIFACIALSVFAASASAQQPSGDTPSYGPELQGFDYPFPVEHLAFTSQQQQLQMAYLDVKPDKPNGKTVVLLHGKNFCSAT